MHAPRDPYAAFRFAPYRFFSCGNFVSVIGRQMLAVPLIPLMQFAIVLAIVVTIFFPLVTVLTTVAAVIVPIAVLLVAVAVTLPLSQCHARAQSQCSRSQAKQFLPKHEFSSRKLRKPSLGIG